LNIIFEYNLLTYFLFVFNLFCFFNSSLDWDTSNHLYEAKLRRNNHNFKSSYRLGIKIFVIKLYELFWNIINKQLKLFRIFSILSFLITFIYLNHLTPENSEKYLILLSYFFFISLYNPQTSATEFFSTLVILIVLNVFSSQSDLIFLGFFIILLNSILFKNIEILYVMPYIFFISNGKLNIIDNDNYFYLLIFILMIMGFLIFLKKKYINTLFHYFLSRTFSKQIKFIIKNFYIIIPIFYWIYDLYNFVDLKFKILIFTYLLIFFIQRGLTSYFYYPVFIFTFYISIINNYFLYNEPFFKILTVIIFISYLITSVLNFIFKDYEVTYRIYNNWYFFIVKEKLLERNLINFINKKVNKEFYFWGSKMLIPLQAKNNQLIDNYYSHNHLLLWKKGDIKEKYNKIKKFLNKKNPKYIVESGSMKNLKMTKEISVKYKKIFSNKVGKVYEKI
jgi:hypothetical protein